MGVEALSIDANTFQVFTRNPRGGSAKEIDPQDAQKLNDLMKEWTIENIPVVEYLKNIEWEGNEYFPMLSVIIRTKRMER